MIPSLRLGNGRIGMTLCPGKVGPSQSGDAWQRSLPADLAQIRDEGYSVVVTLMEWEELRRYQVPHIGIETRKLGIRWVNFPIRDHEVPAEEWSLAWTELSGHLRKELGNFGHILIHCLGGLGRTGTVASMLMQDMGIEAQDSMNMIRARRPGAIENDDQERFVLDYREWISG